MTTKAYEIINSFISAQSNIDKLKYNKYFKMYPYFVVDNGMTHEHTDGSLYASMFFMKNKDDLEFSEKDGHYVVSEAGSYHREMIACRQNLVPNGVYEISKLTSPESKEYNYSQLDSLPVLDNGIVKKSISDIFEVVDEFLSFSIEQAKQSIYEERKDLKIEVVYLETDNACKFGYQVQRVFFKDEIVGYVTSTGRWLGDQSFVVSNSKKFKKMINFIESNYSDVSHDFSEDKILDNFSDEFLYFVDSQIESNNK